MKKIISFILMLTTLASCIVFTASAVDSEIDVWDGTASTTWSDSKETDGKYHIRTAEDLAGFAQLVTNGTNFRGETVCLEADIYLNDVTNYSSWSSTTEGLNAWPCIGNNSYMFEGNFDGQGNTIYGMYIDTKGGEQKGLFATYGGKHSNDISISNLNLEKFYICSTVDNTSHSFKIGALVGQVYTNDGGSGTGDGNTITIENIYVEGVIKPIHLNTSTKTVAAAGICGYMNLSNPKTDSTKATTAVFRNCVINVDISIELEKERTSIKYLAAGIIANNSTASNATLGVNKIVIENCVNLGNMGTSDVGASSAGGLIGSNGNADVITIKNCANVGNLYGHGTGAASSGDSAGGAIAYKKNGTLTVDGFYHEGTIICGKDGGGKLRTRDGIVVGYNNSSTVTASNVYIKSGITATNTDGAEAVDLTKLDVYSDAYTNVKNLNSYANVGEKIAHLLTACGASLKEVGICAIQMSTDKTAIRFIAKINTLEYSEVGFEIKATEGGDVTVRANDTAYTAVSAKTDMGLLGYSAKDNFGAEYLVVDGVKGIPTTGEVTLFVRFYTKPVGGGDASYPDSDGKWYKITIVEGEYQGYEKVELN